MIYLAFTGSMIFLDNTMLHIKYSKSTKFDDIGRSISKSRILDSQTMIYLAFMDLIFFLDTGMLLTGYVKSNFFDRFWQINLQF
jgi:hypothetical protein